MEREHFYDERRIAIIPAGFCYPGKGPSSDMPPRPECARKWQPLLKPLLRQVDLTLVVGPYAHALHLGARRKGSVAETVKAWREYAPGLFPLPHPSPRNRNWLRQHPWFESDVLLQLRTRIRSALDSDEGT